jgi:leader peptidase (prepilin peptidase)/N-methyltransferase
MTGVPAANVQPVHVAFAIVFASLYLLTIVIDAETQLIPDEITITHLLAAWAFFFLARPDVVSADWKVNLIMMLVLPAVFFAMAWMGWMGMGDVVLAAGFGALFGWPLGGIVAVLGFIIGGVLMLPRFVILLVQRRFKFGQHEVAFGPFLAVSAYICLFFGHALVNWYLSLYGLQLLPDWTVIRLNVV